jgi:flagellar basal-body rod protein FlgB
VQLKAPGHELLSRLMSATTQRRDVVAMNIASQNMPGYRRRELEFESLLVDALERGKSGDRLLDIEPEVQIDWDAEVRADGNSVDAERESSLLRENRIRFELYAAILRGRSNLIQQAINSDR